MSVDVLIEKSCVTCGEGPHWDDRNGTLLYVDMEDGSVHRWNSVTRVDEKHTFGTGTFAAFILPRQQGGYVVGLNQQVALFDWDTKEVIPLHTVDEGKQTLLNDAKCDPAGRLWFGTMGIESKPGIVEPNQGTLYSLDVDGTLRKHKEGVSIANGMAWTSDNQTMYFIDSLPRKVFGFDYDLATGSISNERVVVDLQDKSTQEHGLPDGMTIDAEDKLWVACFFAGKVFRFDPETGDELCSVSVPAKLTTSCCFGGPNYDELFITCSRNDLTEEEVAETPLAGSVFRVKGLPAKGLPAGIYKG